jgi:hypothetical protein
MWDVQERDGYCEVGTSQRPNPRKAKDDDDDDDGDEEEEEEEMMVMKLLIYTNCEQVSDCTLFVFQNASHCILEEMILSFVIYLLMLIHMGILHLCGNENKVMVSLLFCV